MGLGLAGAAAGGLPEEEVPEDGFAAGRAASGGLLGSGPFSATPAGSGLASASKATRQRSQRCSDALQRGQSFSAALAVVPPQTTHVPVSPTNIKSRHFGHIAAGAAAHQPSAIARHPSATIFLVMARFLPYSQPIAPLTPNPSSTKGRGG